MTRSVAVRGAQSLDVPLDQGPVVPTIHGRHERFAGWQSKATTNARQIRAWWQRWPDAIPAVVPGLVGKSCVDIDVNREYGDDGFRSLDAAGIDVTTASHVSISQGGHGRHAGFDGVTRSCSEVLPCVDLRSVDDYITEVHPMPPAEDATSQLPPELASAADWSEVYDGRGQSRLDGHGGAPDPALAALVRSIERDAYTWSIDPPRWIARRERDDAVAQVVQLGNAGHEGASAALISIRELWMLRPEPPVTELPEYQFDAAMSRAIKSADGVTNQVDDVRV